MGLLAKKEFHEVTNEITQYEINQIGDNKVFFDFKEDAIFKHGNKMAKLIKLRILENYNKNRCIAPDTAKYICFEIPYDMKLKEFTDKKMFEKLNQIGKFEFLMPNYYNNLGFIEKLENNTYQLYAPTSQLLSYTRDVLDKEITKNDEMFSQRLKKEEFVQKINVSLNEKIENEEIPKKDILLEEQFRYNIGNKVYVNYRAFDTENKEIININKLLELMEDNKQRLYSAFIQKIDPNKKEEIKTLYDKTYGVPVLFTSKLGVEELVTEKNKDKVYCFYNLLSNVSESKRNVIQFIGGMDENGNIIRNQEDCSEEVKQMIRKEQEEFFEKEEEIEIE